MHHEDIKSAIRKKGVTPADLARTLRVSGAMVSRVIRGTDKSEPIAQAIAKVTGLSVNELWPGRYGQQSSSTQRLAALLGTSERPASRSTR